MKSEFIKRYNELDQKREKLFEELSSFSDETINQRPSANSWSIAEVISHLAVADKATLSYLKKKAQDTSRAENIGLKNKFRYGILKFIFNLPIKLKAPSLLAQKKAFKTILEMDISWETTTKETLALIKTIDDKDFNKELFRHPIIGKMNLLQMVNFTHIHFDRHKKQIDRTLINVT